MSLPKNLIEEQFQSVNTEAMIESLEGDGTENNPPKRCQECAGMDLDEFYGPFKKAYITRRSKLSKYDEDFTGEVYPVSVNDEVTEGGTGTGGTGTEGSGTTD